MYYVYIYLDPLKKGSYKFDKYTFEFEPFYIGKGKKQRMYSHLNVAKGTRKGRHNRVIARIKSILQVGMEPIIFKISDLLSEQEAGFLEVSLIQLIGRKGIEDGILMNTTAGGDGGITWIGEHPFKGKKLSEILGEERAKKVKEKVSECASKRVGKYNPNYGNRGEKSKLFGKKHSEETKDRIRKKTIENQSKKSYEEMQESIKKMIDAKSHVSDDVKKIWYSSISSSLKARYASGDLFKDSHREKLRLTNYKKMKKGCSELKLSDETKKKISDKIKGRSLSESHIKKLRKTVSFDEFEIAIRKLIDSLTISNITQYRAYARENKSLKLPVRPELSYERYGWCGWRKYGF